MNRNFSARPHPLFVEPDVGLSNKVARSLRYRCCCYCCSCHCLNCFHFVVVLVEVAEVLDRVDADVVATAVGKSHDPCIVVSQSALSIYAGDIFFCCVRSRFFILPSFQNQSKVSLHQSLSQVTRLGRTREKNCSAHAVCVVERCRSCVSLAVFPS